MKLAFIVGGDGDTFLGDIIRWAMYDKKYDVRVCSMKEITDETAWADIIWCEWATNAAMWASNNSLEHNKIIVRLHRWEAYTPWIQHIKWQSVDRLLVVPNPYTKAQLKGLPTRIIDLPNAINLKRFDFNVGDGRKIAYVGTLNLKKNIPFLLQCFYELLDYDGSYTLHCAGKFQDKIVENYCNHMISRLGLTENTFFEGHQGNINEWLQDKSFIVCPSLVEGHPVAVMEGMACGLKPLTHSFPGAGTFFPPEFIFNTTLEFSQKILDKDYEPEEYREWVANNYPFEQQAAKIEEVFEGLYAKA